MADNHNNSAEYLEKQKEEILRLKQEKNAVILVHNYQREEIQDIADFRGDSLGLSRAATGTDADVIVFCGVYFMAETAAVLSPDKKVLLPVKEAGCPMADMITARRLIRVKEKHPDTAVVCYVNTSAEVKAECDICCTSSNAIKVVNSITDHDRVIFVPDRYLARWVDEHTDKKIIYYQGFCPTHYRLTEDDVLKAKAEHPDAEFVAHPECSFVVLKLADHVASTSGMFTYVKSSSSKKFIIGTEMGLLTMLRRENPDKEFYLPSGHLICANMKLTTLGWVVEALKHEQHVVTVDPVVREKAKRALDRMLALP